MANVKYVNCPYCGRKLPNPYTVDGNEKRVGVHCTNLKCGKHWTVIHGDGDARSIKLEEVSANKATQKGLHLDKRSKCNPFCVCLKERFLGRRGLLLHLLGLPCQYHRRVVAAKFYHH